MKKINICSIPFDNVTMEEALLLAENELQKKGASVVVTPNAEIAEMCIEDETIRQIILGAEIILPDGAGIITAAEILGTPLKEKVAGVEFGMELIRNAERNGYSLFFLGGKPTVAKTAAEKLKTMYPALKIVGTHNGYFEKTGKENDAVIEEINASSADILFVCLGAPTQEKWIMANREKLTAVRLAACLGGSLDIYAGTAKRAPKIFIKFRLEWFYRLLREPKRLGRMMKIPKYLRHVKEEAKQKENLR
jgi:N-acetylglucosaminyldiphosphoundecaprenol N-acetyl-beta-D-mannosaminyltransferase